MGGMFFWWFITIAIIVLVIVQGVKRSGLTGEPSSSSAEDVLRQRYAADEIEKTDYENRLKELRK